MLVAVGSRSLTLNRDEAADLSWAVRELHDDPFLEHADVDWDRPRRGGGPALVKGRAPGGQVSR